jgi:hypothetical protein
LAIRAEIKNIFTFTLIFGKEGLPEPVLRAGQSFFSQLTGPYDTGTSGMPYLP